jgi:hypothetical protein
VTVGQAYNFQPQASDPDGDALTYSISNKPAWASFSSTTGRLSGTPGSGTAGTYSGITISVSDGTLSASLPAFAITVQSSNRAPSISGTPPSSVTVGEFYDFRPTASDPDGDRLTFSISSRPAWAAFDSATGRLAGTPAAGDAGSYDGINISVSDGQASASLPTFGVTVTPGRNGSVTVSWTPPTTNTDGSPLQDLRGFRIYYGTISSSLTSTMDVADPGLTSAVVEDLPPGTWYFGVRAYNASNAESDLSNVASKTIN